MNTREIIRVEHLSKCYKLFTSNGDRVREALSLRHKVYHRNHYALRDISFSVHQGETVGIIGTNGSGKSTLLKILTGVTTASEGNVTIDGRISALLELGAGFNPEYSGRENIYLNGMMMGYTGEQIREKEAEIIAFADIGEFIDQPVKTYSSGMFVRLAFAVAINIDPEILIVDEALSVGDVFFQAKCYKKFEDFKKKGKTILIVSHDLGSISKYCDRVILLNRGVKLGEGEPKEMVDRYKKVLVGLDEQTTVDKPTDDMQTAELRETNWKQSLKMDERCDEYGNGKAKIEDFAIVDEDGNITNILSKGKEFSIRMRVRFFEPVESPIYAFAIKDVKGTTITGTNSMYERVDTGSCVPGECYIMEYTQRMTLQGGEYLLSLGCTGYENGELTVYHRLYDVCSMTVVMDKVTDGLYDLYPTHIFHKL